MRQKSFTNGCDWLFHICELWLLFSNEKRVLKTNMFILLNVKKSSQHQTLGICESVHINGYLVDFQCLDLLMTDTPGLLSSGMWCVTCVVAALKEMPRREQRPRPAATDNVTSRTPASPTAP